MPDAPPPIPVGVPPEEAIAIFRAKGFLAGFAWQDVWQEEHARAFTVAKAMTRDVLETIREAVDRAIADGETLADFRSALTPKLQALGWWGRKRVIDPKTMTAETAQLGSPRRLKTIFQVNMRTAYAQGRWERIERNKALLPFLQYSAVMDGRERPEHGAWNGTVKPVDDPWWDTHYPPCGWNCRCTVKPLSAKMMERRGLAVTDEPAAFPPREWRNKRTGEVHAIEEGIDPGWAYHVGRAPTAGTAPEWTGLPDDQATASAIRPGGAEFLAAFGIAEGEERAWVDAGGWPLRLSAEWLAGAPRTGLAEAAGAMLRPTEIRWCWSPVPDGPNQLVRRYLRGAMVVDVARAGWRFGRVDDPDRFRRGRLAWTGPGV